jgi:hypothetical protein
VNSLGRGDATKGELADHLWRRQVGNIENNAAAIAIRNVCPIAFHMSRPMTGKLQATRKCTLFLLRQ